MANKRALAGLLAGAAAAPARFGARHASRSQAIGELPGFHIEDAAPWLAAQMEEDRRSPGAFAARDHGAAAPDRVEWTFEVLPYAGGQVRQFFPMPGGANMLGANG